jgi:Domain of unknown function (DUF4351)
MSRTPFDSFSKQLFEELLAPFGTVQVNQEVPGESQFIDLYFVPSAQNTTVPESLELLRQMGASPCSIEPFHNPVTEDEICSCLSKLLTLRSKILRDAKREQLPRAQVQLPHLWILSPTLSAEILTGFEAKPQVEELSGIYRLPALLRSTIILIHQLPVTPETLWLRLLGRGRVLQHAIAEVLALPDADNHRVAALQLLVSWKISIEVTGIQTEQEDAMALSQAYLEWEQQTEQRGLERGKQEGERSTLLKILTRKLGELPAELRSSIESLSIEQLELLGDVLFDFSSIDDLKTWLEGH